MFAREQSSPARGGSRGSRRFPWDNGYYDEMSLKRKCMHERGTGLISGYRRKKARKFSALNSDYNLYRGKKGIILQRAFFVEFMTIYGMQNTSH